MRRANVGSFLDYTHRVNHPQANYSLTRSAIWRGQGTRTAT
ncbi:MAG: hypothetical protein RL667_1219, partial [Pseudomonadota bacterium]